MFRKFILRKQKLYYKQNRIKFIDFLPLLNIRSKSSHFLGRSAPIRSESYVFIGLHYLLFVSSSVLSILVSPSSSSETLSSPRLSIAAKMCQVVFNCSSVNSNVSFMQVNSLLKFFTFDFGWYRKRSSEPSPTKYRYRWSSSKWYCLKT